MSKSRMAEYRVWAAMKSRCRRGGTALHHRWRLFDLFIADVGARPSARHRLSRKDKAKGFEPGNVSWTARELQKNRKSRKLTRRYGDRHEFKGKVKTVAEWAREYRKTPGMSRRLLAVRLSRGWDIGRALKTPATGR